MASGYTSALIAALQARSGRCRPRAAVKFNSRRAVALTVLSHRTGKYLYYGKQRGKTGIWRVQTAGGEEELVVDQHRAGFWRQWTVTERGIFFATEETRGHALIEFYSFATGKVSLVMNLDKGLPDTISGLSVSPDGRRLIWTQLDHVSSDITLMNNFH
jgi:hypothetical protein